MSPESFVIVLFFTSHISISCFIIYQYSVFHLLTFLKRLSDVLFKPSSHSASQSFEEGILIIQTFGRLLKSVHSRQKMVNKKQRHTKAGLSVQICLVCSLFFVVAPFWSILYLPSHNQNHCRFITPRNPIPPILHGRSQRASAEETNRSQKLSQSITMVSYWSGLKPRTLNKTLRVVQSQKSNNICQSSVFFGTQPPIATTRYCDDDLVFDCWTWSIIDYWLAYAERKHVWCSSRKYLEKLYCTETKFYLRSKTLETSFAHAS